MPAMFSMPHLFTSRHLLSDQATGSILGKLAKLTRNKKILFLEVMWFEEKTYRLTWIPTLAFPFRHVVQIIYPLFLLQKDPLFQDPCEELKSYECLQKKALASVNTILSSTRLVRWEESCTKEWTNYSLQRIAKKDHLFTGKKLFRDLKILEVTNSCQIL